MIECVLCHATSKDTWDCISCDEAFCEDCYDRHFAEGPHVVVGQDCPTEWRKGNPPLYPRKSMGAFTYTDDFTGRGIWIPAHEPEEWN